MFTRKQHPRPGKFWITDAKRLLQQNLPTTDLCIATKEGAMPSEIVKPSAFVVLKLTTSYELFRPSVSYPIAIRLRRSRREATSMRYVTSANTAHPPWNSTPAASYLTGNLGCAAKSVRARHNLPIALTPFSFRKLRRAIGVARKKQNPAAGGWRRGSKRDGLKGYGLGMAVLLSKTLPPIFCGSRTLPVPVGNLRSEILVVQSAQNWHCQRATDSLDGTRNRRVLVQR